MKSLVSEFRGAIIAAVVIFLFGVPTTYFGIYKKIDAGDKLRELIATTVTENSKDIKAMWSCLDNTVANQKVVIELSEKSWGKDAFLKEKERQLKMWENNLQERRRLMDRESNLKKEEMHVKRMMLVPEPDRTFSPIIMYDDAPIPILPYKKPTPLKGPEWTEKVR